MNFKSRSFAQSLNDAVAGFLHVIKNERNMRVHFLAAFLTLLLAAFLGVPKVEWMILSVSICFILVTEMVNTAIEESIDLVNSSFHPIAKIVKDISAGMVLVSALNALIVGYFIFSKYLTEPALLLRDRIQYAPSHILFIALVAIIFLVVTLKAFGHKGMPFRGGVVSGHAAIAFALWTLVFLNQPNLYIAFAVLFLAVLLAESRIRTGIHTIWEVTAGAIIGIIVTALFFKLFS